MRACSDSPKADSKGVGGTKNMTMSKNITSSNNQIKAKINVEIKSQSDKEKYLLYYIASNDIMCSCTHLTNFACVVVCEHADQLTKAMLCTGYASSFLV